MSPSKLDQKVDILRLSCIKSYLPSIKGSLPSKVSSIEGHHTSKVLQGVNQNCSRFFLLNFSTSQGSKNSILDIFKLSFLFLCRYRKYPNYFYLVKFGPGFCKYYKKIILKVNIFVYCWIMSRKRAGSRFIANARVYDSCACICARIFMKFET